MSGKNLSRTFGLYHKIIDVLAQPIARSPIGSFSARYMENELKSLGLNADDNLDHFNPLIKEARERMTPSERAEHYRRVRRAQEMDIKHVHMPAGFAEAHDPWRNTIINYMKEIESEQAEKKSWW